MTKIGLIATIVGMDTERRLNKRHFRGVNMRLAGNFSIWKNVMDMFRDGFVVDSFLDDVVKGAHAAGTRENSVCIDYGGPVGWESTDEKSLYGFNDLERYRPEGTYSVLRVRRYRTLLTAPKTSRVTIVYEYKIDEGRHLAIVHSIYPGNDVGELVGDVTGREKRVFFDLNHPGAR